MVTRQRSGWLDVGPAGADPFSDRMGSRTAPMMVVILKGEATLSPVVRMAGFAHKRSGRLEVGKAAVL